MKHVLFCGVIFSVLLLWFVAPAMAELQGVVTVFHAGSLSVPLEKIEKDFEALHPGVDIQREAGGSTKLARLIAEEGKPADILVSADYMVIDQLLIPQFAAANIRFATNQLVLCYTDKSKFSAEINTENWTDILAREDVVWGHSDPNVDPCGYRSLMVLQLAEKHYQLPGLYEKLLNNRPQANIRPKADELVDMLKTGEMDYAWEYLSVAVQHGLKYVSLPDEINLGNYQFDKFYSQAKVEVTDGQPDKTVTLSGASVTYGLTLINNAPNPDAATAFLAYLLDPEGGLKVLKDMGQPPFVPARVPTEEMRAKLPVALQALVEAKK